MTSKPRSPAASAQIPLSAPYMLGNELAYVTESVTTTWVSTAGSFTTRFEREIAHFVGARHAVATNSGTAALHVALLLAGIEAEDEVLVSDMTFIAPVNAIRYIGAWPVFFDAEDAYWQLDVDRLARFLERDCTPKDGFLYNRSSGRRVRGILPVHLLGHPCDLD